ncbi:MAG: hypothetical protein WC895_02530 [Candidatus Shapirobacteria bacterium]
MKNKIKFFSGKIFGIDISLTKVFLVPLVVIIVFLITLAGVISPKVSEIVDLGKNIKAMNSQIKSVQEKRAYLLSIDQEQLKRDAQYLDSAVFQEKNSYLLVGVIRNIADKHNFQIKSFSINPIKLKDESNQTLKVAEKNVAVKMPINVVLSGPSDKNLDLIKALENSLPILFIDKFNISSLAGFSDLDLTISSYYVPNNQDFVSGNLSLSDLKPTKAETELLITISKFEKNNSSTETDKTDGEKSFVKYERTTPFTP